MKPWANPAAAGPDRHWIMVVPGSSMRQTIELDKNIVPPKSIFVKISRRYMEFYCTEFITNTPFRIAKALEF
jgi:hypothetical protein